MFGVLGLVGIYLGRAGWPGALMDAGLGVTVGLVRYLAPVLFLVCGYLLLRNRGAATAGPSLGVAGIILLLVAATGLLHVIRFDNGAADLGDELVGAGGGVGAISGHPLGRYLGGGGAALVLLALGVAGVAVLARANLRQAGEGVAVLAHGAAGGIGRALVRGIQALFQAPEGEIEPPAPRRRSPKPTPRDDLPADESATRDRRDGDAVAIHLPDPAPPAVADDAFHPPAARAQTHWTLPPAKLLHRSNAQEIDRNAVARTGRALERALAEHGVETRLVNMVVGPTVTRYELELAPGVKVSRVTSLHKDIAYAMASADVRILAPIPGKQAIGVEVPNVHRQLVTLGDILSSEEARKAGHPLEVAMGRDISGRAVMANLGTMPHILIAGQTGAGKSSCINTLITSVLMRTTPDQVRMILIDPKRVELGQYNRLPHLLTQVVTNPKKAANALAWAVREMERRYDLLSEVGVRDIVGYNEAYDRGDLSGEESETLRKVATVFSNAGVRGAGADAAQADMTFPRLPYIIVVVDELNDLMMVAARDVEDSICRIAQMARAVGIHLVIATQRPSVNVITGVIKANVPARLAFAVSSLADSRVILDQPGAERLVGRGDMLLLGGNTSTAQRIQGSWVTEEEVRAVAAHWRRQAPEVRYVEGVEGSDDDAQGSLFDGVGGGDDEDDAGLLRQARELVVRSQLGSTSMLQRKLRVGFARAGRIMDLLEQQGVVGPSTGSKAREVLMSPDELDELSARGG
jgi:S-DNA-T family DNA segregation ATPase FtsK/SpoIIIE